MVPMDILEHRPGLIVGQIRAYCLHVLDAPDDGNLLASGEQLVNVDVLRVLHGRIPLMKRRSRSPALVDPDYFCSWTRMAMRPFKGTTSKRMSKPLPSLCGKATPISVHFESLPSRSRML